MRLNAAILTGVKSSEDNKFAGVLISVRLFYVNNRKEQKENGVSNQKTERYGR